MEMKHGTADLAAFVVLLFLSPAPAWPEMVVQTCFSPLGKCSAHIIREIDHAKVELLIAVYAFTSDDLAGAVVKAKRRGVSIQVIIDREFDMGNPRSKGKFLEAHQVAIRRVSGRKFDAHDKDAGLMHQKFAVIDRKILFTGSYNWTYAADNLNDESLLLFRDAGPLSEEYRKVFFSLWERRR